ncbi:MAG: hypothetical protein UT43_C0049G0001, partial [Parcubacteria group bacterium GW2011_GWC1_39_29]
CVAQLVRARHLYQLVRLNGDLSTVQPNEIDIFDILISEE